MDAAEKKKLKKIYKKQNELNMVAAVAIMREALEEKGFAEENNNWRVEYLSSTQLVVRIAFKYGVVVKIVLSSKRIIEEQEKILEGLDELKEMKNRKVFDGDDLHVFLIYFRKKYEISFNDVYFYYKEGNFNPGVGFFYYEIEKHLWLSKKKKIDLRISERRFKEIDYLVVYGEYHGQKKSVVLKKNDFDFGCIWGHEKMSSNLIKKLDDFVDSFSSVKKYLKN